MGLLLIGLALVVIGAIVVLHFYRRWVEPWQEMEQLAHSITHDETPRKFLTTANKRANAIGLGLETFTIRQREVERAASEGSLNLQNIFSALPDGVAVIDPQRRLQLFNARLSRLFAAAAPGMSVLEFVHDPLVDRAVALALERGEAQTEMMTISHGVERRQLEVAAIPFGNEKARVGGAVVLFRDVTKMRQVEEMRRDFVANVSHELRTPLSIFRGYLETLIDDPQQPPDEMARILEVMDRHADRLTLLVEDILNLAQLESAGARLDLSAIRLPEFLGGILRDWEKRFDEKELHASLRIAEDIPPMTADEHRLGEVVYNLLDNALKYSHPKGEIVLGAERSGSEELCIFVSDQGIGIPGRDLPRVFERFYRVDKARSREVGGTGLGLSIVKHIAQMHGGRVQAESTLGRGATIRVFFPLTARTGKLSSAVPGPAVT